MHIPGRLFSRLRTPERRLGRVLRAAACDHYYNRLLIPGPVLELERFPFTDPDRWKCGRRLAEIPEAIGHPLCRRVLAGAPGPGRRRYTAIAGAAALLLERGRQYAKNRPEVEFAVLVVERPGDGELSEAARDELWDAFQVPVYRLLLGFDGSLLAHECEALCGLHGSANALFEEHDGAVYVTSLTDRRNPSVRLRTSLAARIEHGPCDCGRSGLRLATAWCAQAEMSSAAD